MAFVCDVVERPSSNSRLRFFSSFASVFAVDLEDSRMRWPANQNSYHQISPREKTAILLAPLTRFSASHRRFHQRGELADLGV